MGNGMVNERFTMVLPGIPEWPKRTRRPPRHDHKDYPSEHMAHRGMRYYEAGNFVRRSLREFAVSDGGPDAIAPVGTLALCRERNQDAQEDRHNSPQIEIEVRADHKSKRIIWTDDGPQSEPYLLCKKEWRRCEGTFLWSIEYYRSIWKPPAFPQGYRLTSELGMRLSRAVRPRCRRRYSLYQPNGSSW